MSERDRAVLLLENALASDDKKTALEQLRLLAQLGEQVSFAAVARLYENGTDLIQPNLALAFSWYQKSADEERDQDGYFGMARFYFNGKHVQQDLVRAFEGFSEAFEKGSPEAAIMVGYCCIFGFGTLKDLDRAVVALSFAAERGYVVAFGLLSKVESTRRNRFKAMRLWWRCVVDGARLSKSDPNSPKLYWLHGKT